MSALPQVGYVRVRSVDEVFAALESRGARLYAGGTDLLVALKERRPEVASVRLLVDIKSLEAAQGISASEGTLRIGALTTAHELATHPLVARHAPALAEAAARTASPALRRRCTIGGNLITPHPAGDVATALLALDATVESATSHRDRSVEAVDRILDRTALPRLSSLLLAVQVPLGSRSAFEKLGRRSGFSRARAAVAVARRRGGLRIALAGQWERPRIVPELSPGDEASGEPFGPLLARALRRLEGEP